MINIKINEVNQLNKICLVALFIRTEDNDNLNIKESQ